MSDCCGGSEAIPSFKAQQSTSQDLISADERLRRAAGEQSSSADRGGCRTIPGVGQRPCGRGVFLFLADAGDSALRAQGSRLDACHAERAELASAARLRGETLFRNGPKSGFMTGLVCGLCRECGIRCSRVDGSRASSEEQRGQRCEKRGQGEHAIMLDRAFCTSTAEQRRSPDPGAGAFLVLLNPVHTLGPHEKQSSARGGHRSAHAHHAY